MVIGMQFKMPAHRLIELGASALLHEAGMAKMPSTVIMQKGPLTQSGKEALFKHPQIGYELLKEANFQLSLCLPALEHHERENGTGYPRGITGNQIDFNSKIISVCCAFEAITAKRPYKDARDSYAAMMELLHNEKKVYDDSVIRALVFALSVFPIGSYVLLSNNKKAQVIDANPEDPRFPIVQLYEEQTDDGKGVIVKTSKIGIRILRPLTKEEMPLGESRTEKTAFHPPSSAEEPPATGTLAPAQEGEERLI
jgi:HD-GYP domain-containing protein (c-di-GMP phosphodiesterase class II)